MLEVGGNVTTRDPKGEGGYEDVKFQKEIGGTKACMKRLAIATKGCVQLTSNDTSFADSWFSVVNTADETMAAGVDYSGPVKTPQNKFSRATLEKLMKYWLGGSYIVMNSTPKVPGCIPLLAICYK